MDSKIRRQRFNLYYSGRAFIWFGIWTVIKLYLYFYFSPPDFREIERESSFSIQVIRVLWYVILTIIACLPIVIHIYIGISAMKDSRGKKKTPIYLVITAAYLTVSVISLVNTLSREEIDLIATMSTAIIEVSLWGIMIFIIYSAIRLRKLRKHAASLPPVQEMEE